jgi:hypothetical protein
MVVVGELDQLAHPTALVALPQGARPTEGYERHV